jgi:hypothetical protein
MTEAPKNATTVIDMYITNIRTDSEKMIQDVAAAKTGASEEQLKVLNRLEKALPHLRDESVKLFDNLRVAAAHLSSRDLHGIFRSQWAGLSFDAETKGSRLESALIEKKLGITLGEGEKLSLRTKPDSIKALYDKVLGKEGLPQEIKDKLANSAKTHVEELTKGNAEIAKPAKGLFEQIKLPKKQGEKGFFSEAGRMVKENFGEHAKWTEKVGRGVAGVAGGGLAIKGLSDLKEDEQGNRHYFKAGAEVAMGAVIAAAALVAQLEGRGAAGKLAAAAR